VGGILIFCGIEPCSGSVVCTDAGRGTGVEEEGGVVVFEGSNSANVFCFESHNCILNEGDKKKNSTPEKPQYL
jgi:formylmethanofuran dehydrogenase subunit C